MIDVLWNIVCCIGLIVLILMLIMACVGLIGGIIRLIQIVKENTQ